jgi:hypothetical protein
VQISKVPPNLLDYIKLAEVFICLYSYLSWIFSEAASEFLYVLDNVDERIHHISDI